MYYMYTLPVISSVDYEKMNSYYFLTNTTNQKKHLHRPSISMGLHKFAYGCNFTDQINGLHVLCKCPKRTFGHHMVFDYEKEEREREKLLKSKKKIVFFFKNSYLK